jgi:SAM-dependent methyltransferase
MRELANATGEERVGDIEKLVRLVNGGAMSQAMSVAADLGIADLLASGPKSADQLAHAAGCDPSSLRRLLRALASADLCNENDDGSFSLTRAGSLLRDDATDSLRYWAIWWGQYLWPEWGNLLHSVKTGESARTLATQTIGLDHLEHDAEAAAIFNRAMTELTRLIAGSVARSYNFSEIRRIVDVGGGYGELLAAILSHYPALSGVLFDRPHAMAGARRLFEAHGISSRCETVAGNFFEFVPTGADCYLLKSVIHDWNDERSLVILQTCRKAVAMDGKLLLVEQIMPDRMEPSLSHQDVARRDLTMLIGPGGRERTEQEFGNLLDAGGFKLKRSIPATLNFFLLEAVPI